ncbi:MAG: Gfo/Idh/MocA family protein [Halobacteriales archaeon]
MTYTAAMIGVGEGEDSAGIGYNHAHSYWAVDGVELVACADLVYERAEAFAAEFGLGADRAYGDYEAMLEEARPDVVSVTVSPAAHAPITIGAARTGVPEAIHCEKPMADTYGAARRMAEVCWREDIQLTFNHQRRFADPWLEAADLLEAGEVGNLRRIEAAAPNLFDWGTHVVDLANMFAEEATAEWVLGNLDYRRESEYFGVPHEGQGLATWAYDTGVHALFSTGDAGGSGDGPDAGLVGAMHRLEGSAGTIEVNGEGSGRPPLRIRRDGESEWSRPDHERTEPGDAWERTIREVIAALEADREPAVSSRRALAATEIIMAVYESSRRRGRVDLPLEIDDHPLVDMIERGEVTAWADEQ